MAIKLIGIVIIIFWIPVAVIAAAIVQGEWALAAIVFIIMLALIGMITKMAFSEGDNNDS